MELVLALILGLVIGSFLNVCILRIPQEVPITVPRSHCPHCKKLIRWYDNVPVLSYLILGGRCRRCKKKISARYPLIEAVSGLISVLLYLKFGLGVEWVLFFGFSAALLVLAFIDLDHRILPDVITLNGMWLGVLSSVYLAQPIPPIVLGIVRVAGLEVTNPRILALVGSLLGVVAGGGLLWGVGEAFKRLRGIEGMGFGDVKMMAMVGAFLGAPMALFTIMLGSILGSVIGLVFMGFTGKSRDYELPFGTFLGVAGIVVVLYGENLVQFLPIIRPAV
ncbi:MAG: prepilin peptidase [Acidobacteria bacterium]|nr:MAG: prepilin peptidase [Acidobacteriota bacterium]